MARRRRRRSRAGAEESSDTERWMISYSDMLTVLLGLFIVLYAFSLVDVKKFTALSASLADAFNGGHSSVLQQGSGVLEGTGNRPQPANGPEANVVNPIATAPGQSPQASPQNSTYPSSGASLDPRARQEYDQLAGMREQMQAALDQRGLGTSVRFSVDRRGLIVTVVTDELIFPGNSAVLQQRGQDVVDALGPTLRDSGRSLEVDGHTNQLNVSTAEYPSGWELSSARASAVVRYLIDHEQLAKGDLTAVGFSDTRPLVPPDDPQSVTRNRRVDIVVLSTLPAALADELPQAAGSAG